MSQPQRADSRPIEPQGPGSYGFVIDGRSCIGCHACSTACKSENEVPLGVYRTWVKTTETGRYPDVSRQFQVTRCNHCANPPCARICPTRAMYQRADGIVEFDSRACIGCKACMQACPYDAIHIDPESGTAAKCHFCSHRIELGLEPACVVVCPEHAILAGDMDDPRSEISRILAREQVTVRKPEQGTAPKLFYIEGHAVALHPTAIERPTSFAATDVLSGPGAQVREPGAAPSPFSAQAQYGTKARPDQALRGDDGRWRRPIQPQGLPHGGPIQIGGRRADHMAQLSYNAQHKVPWHWPVPAYLVTKAIGSGLLILLAFAWAVLELPFHAGTAIGGGLLALLALGATTGLLVLDLERPERFLTLLTRPNWASWLTRGAVLLIGLSTLGGLWWASETSAALGLIEASSAEAVRGPLLLGTGLFGVGAAIYTAFLFGQAEGRDLWQSPLLPVHLLIQALMMGGASLALLDLFLVIPTELSSLARWTFGSMLIADAFVTLAGELAMPHASEIAARAAHDIHAGRFKAQFWWGSVVLGHLCPLALLLIGGPLAGALAALCAGAGLYFYEYAFVMAPQHVPNS